jgi:hypothetical protein
MLDCKSFVIVASRVVVVAYFHSSTFPKGTKTGEREKKKTHTQAKSCAVKVLGLNRSSLSLSVPLITHSRHTIQVNRVPPSQKKEKNCKSA